MKRLVLIIICFVFLLLNGCKNSNKEVVRIVKELSGKTVSFDWPKQYCLYDTTLVFRDDYLMAPVRIVKHVDDSYCSSCLYNYLSVASDFLNNARKSNLFNSDSVEYYIILSRPKEEIIDCFQEKNLPRIILVSDVENKYIEINSLSHFDDTYTTFLLDRNNRIMGIGDPMLSVGVRDMYIKRIKELLE